MVIQTRYRDISYEEILELHPTMKPAPREQWENLLRGSDIEISTPPTGSTIAEAEA